MAGNNYSKVNLTSSNLSEEKLAELRRVLPEAFSENKIDWERLRAVLGDAVDDNIEKFSFTWAGKSNAVKNVLIPSSATLRPAKDESVKFDASENLFIEGDNLEVLKLLQKAYFEKVKMIYIDPPYNTGGDFVYHDDFAAPLKNYLQQTGQVDAEGNKLQTNRETSGRFHSDWLSMMYPRLKLAWNLLREDGVIFISIDDNEVHHLRTVMDEIFGEENFIAQFIHKNNSSKNQAKLVSVSTEYILGYTKSLVTLKSQEWKVDKKGAKDIAQLYSKLKGEGLSLEEIDKQVKEMYSRPKYAHLSRWNKVDDKGVFKDADLSREGGAKDYTIVNPETGQPCIIPDRGWGKSYQELLKLQEKKLIWYGDPSTPPGVKDYITDEDVSVPDSFWYFDNSIDTRWIKSVFGSLIFENPKPLEMIKRMVSMATTEDDLILDFFAGSGTTGNAVLEQNQQDENNRRFILVQLPEQTKNTSKAYKAGFKNISDITKERLRKIISGYGEKPQPINDGFKIFKLSESNYPENNFEFDPKTSEEENKQVFEKYLSNARQIKLFDDTKTIDVVYENIIKEGYSLNSKIIERKIGKNNAYFVTDGERQLLVCLDKKIDEKTVSELAGKDYKGKTFICLDNALDDTAKANLGLHVELKTI